MEDFELNEVEGAQSSVVGGPAKAFVDQNGVFMGWFASPPEDHTFYDVPEDWIEVPWPEAGDQVWNFETQSWGESPSAALNREKQWREEEMEFIADQLLRIQDDDPTALAGTDRQWRDYRILVRAWVEGFVGFPDPTLRPVRPS